MSITVKSFDFSLAGLQIITSEGFASRARAATAAAMGAEAEVPVCSVVQMWSGRRRASWHTHYFQTTKHKRFNINETKVLLSFR